LNLKYLHWLHGWLSEKRLNQIGKKNFIHEGWTCRKKIDFFMYAHHISFYFFKKKDAYEWG
jgi:hypothetical protein